MKIAIIALILLIHNTMLSSQGGSYWKMYKGDSLEYKKRGNTRFGKASVQFYYPNGQLRYKGDIVDGHNMGTRVYYSEQGDTLAVINYDYNFVNFMDTKYEANRKFTSTILEKSEKKIKESFGNYFSIIIFMYIMESQSNIIILNPISHIEQNYTSHTIKK